MMEYVYGRYGVQMYGGFLVEDGVKADFPLVGSRRTVTNEFCGTFSRNFGCLESHLHVNKAVPVGVLGQRTFDGKVHGGKAVVFVHAFRCTDPLCPECCLHWAKLQYARAKRRFDAFDLKFDSGFGLEHVVVSVPRFDWDKDLKFMRSQVSAFACAVGVSGFMCIYHPKRYNRSLKCWYFSPHFHLLGYCENGVVDGGLVSLLYSSTGYVLKKLSKRKSVYGTIMYQLSHAGIPDGRKCAVTWHGELNYRKGKSMSADLYNILYPTKEPRVCPICGNVLVHVCRVAGSGHFDYERFEDKFLLDDVDNWTVVPSRKRKSDDLDNPYID